MKVARQFIKMGDQEWGNPLMNQLAQEAYDDIREAYPMALITVSEHGGWFLSFIPVEGTMTVAGTANDRAEFSQKVINLRSQYNEPEIEWVYLPTVWRT